MERLAGPTMLADLGDHPVARSPTREHARRTRPELHEIPQPRGSTTRGKADRRSHLDIHPKRDRHAGRTRRHRLVERGGRAPAARWRPLC